MPNDWESLGKLDPLWAILTDAGKQFSQWDEEEFFATGRVYVEKLLATLEPLGRPASHETALDFGCGVGRLTRHLAPCFKSVVGLDASPSMIALATAKNTHLHNSKFILCTEPRLPFPNEAFDFVHTVIVLQHLPAQAALAYIREFLRVLRPGGMLVFQVPYHMPFRRKFQPRRRLWKVLRALGFREEFLYKRLKLHPIRMTAISEQRVTTVVEKQGGRIVNVNHDDGFSGPSIPSNTYFVAKGQERRPLV